MQLCQRPSQIIDAMKPVEGQINANGRINAKSRSAIKSFQVSQGVVPDGFASADLLERLRQP